MTLSVKTRNRHAIALYERHGFVDAGPSPDTPANTECVGERSVTGERSVSDD